MKAKIFFLLAAIMLSCASAFAQSGNSDPLKGDVNGDGVVDVADITSVIKIMKDGGGTVDNKNYFYVGITKPTSLDQCAVVSEYPIEQTYTNPSSSEKNYFHVLTTTDKTVDFYDPSDLSTPSTKEEDLETIPGYKITSMTVRVAKGGTQVIKISDAEPTYYFSVGTVAPTADNYTTVNNATTTIPTTQEFTNNSGRKSLIYILVPSNKTVTATDLAITSIISPLIEDTSITIPNHKVYVTDGKIANGGGIKITIS